MILKFKLFSEANNYGPRYMRHIAHWEITLYCCYKFQLVLACFHEKYNLSVYMSSVLSELALFYSRILEYSIQIWPNSDIRNHIQIGHLIYN